MDAEPSFKVHQKSVPFMNDATVHLQITSSKDSVFAWVGTDGRLQNLAASVPSKFGSNVAPATTLLGSDVDEMSQLLARRLATKYNRQFFVSFNISSVNSDNTLTLFAEKALIEMLKEVL
ncbi:uncharacterized protein VTP21DRAFT_8698 [Calcarisporiella thermophila]|uniref:uncharacterized protein n=1 Tax=Calcarisporiella thermophila TaxID=911321 RepID=UPI0037441668